MQTTYCNHVVFFIIVPVHSCKLQELPRCCCRVVTFLKYGPARPAEPSERRSCTTCPCPEDKYCHEASVLVANKPGSGVAYSTEPVCVLYACDIVYAKLVSDISGGSSACTKQCWRHSRAFMQEDVTLAMPALRCQRTVALVANTSVPFHRRAQLFGRTPPCKFESEHGKPGLLLSIGVNRIGRHDCKTTIVAKHTKTNQPQWMFDIPLRLHSNLHAFQRLPPSRHCFTRDVSDESTGL